MKDAEEPGDGRVALGDNEGLLFDAETGGDAVGDALAVPVAADDRDEDADVAAGGEKIAGWGVPEGVHPATAAEIRTTKVAAPTAGVARAFIKPPVFDVEVGDGPRNLRSTLNGVFSI